MSFSLGTHAINGIKIHFRTGTRAEEEEERDGRISAKRR